MKKIKVLNFGVEDDDGDVFIQEHIKEIKGKIPIFMDFKPCELIGYCRLSMNDDGVFAEITYLKTGIKINGLYPAIGFKRNKGQLYPITIYQIGFCSKPNIDLTIDPINL